MTQTDDQQQVGPVDSKSAGAFAATWEQRQKHTAFYQTQVSAIQQAALAFNTTGTLVLTLAVAMSKLSGITEGNDWAAILIGVLGWLALTVLLTGGYSRSARRVMDAYLIEHALLFPGATPYRLESYLLRYPDRKANRWKQVAGRAAAEQTGEAATPDLAM